MRNTFFALFALALAACGGNQSTESATEAATDSSKVVNLYTHRHYDSDKALYEAFTKETGIEVNVVKAGADELIVRMENEGTNSPADLLVTVDAGRLHLAREKGLLQPISNAVLEANIPAQYRDPQGYWFGQTVRARVIVAAKDRVDSASVQSYMDLTKPQFKGKVLMRPSDNVYNQSLLAGIIAHYGDEQAAQWVKGVVANMAREPRGNDRDQVKDIYAGQGDLAVINTYYLGNLLHSDNPEEVKAGESVRVIFPGQGEFGTHVNVSGAGVAKYAPNKANAIALLEFLSRPENQTKFAGANYEYPVHPEAEIEETLRGWGDFKRDELPLDTLGKLNSKAVELFNQNGWQ